MLALGVPFNSQAVVGKVQPVNDNPQLVVGKFAWQIVGSQAILIRISKSLSNDNASHRMCSQF